jgi:hypothetical protein
MKPIVHHHFLGDILSIGLSNRHVNKIDLQIIYNYSEQDLILGKGIPLAGCIQSELLGPSAA